MSVVYYTGGTTGHPKGVVHTHRSVAANLLSHIIEGDIRRRERMLVTTPLSHSAGLFSLAGLLMGATVTIHSAFSVADEVSNGQASWTFLVPTMIYRLLDEVARHGRLANLDTIVYGASPITPHRLRQALGALDAGFIQLYGQTECPNFGTTLDKREHLQSLHDDALLGACGKASTMADVAVMVGREIAKPGGGMNVYPAEVEAALQRLADVAQVAVIGVPHDSWGEAVCAFIVRRPGSDLDDQAVLGFARAELGSYKRPKHVEFVDSLPLTAVGKVDKKALRAPFWSGKARQIG